MSRRKQSNPKPLKRPSDEDSEDGEEGETTRAKLKREIELPPDILELQPCNEEGRDVAVCAAIRLPKGSSLGPFVGEPIEEESEESNDNTTAIEFTNHQGKAVPLRMGENGRWLSLMKRKDENIATCSVYYDGDKIWCEIRRDILIHSELTGVFTIDDPDLSPRRPMTPDNPEPPETRDRVSTESVSPATSPQTSPLPSAEQTPPVHPLIYSCPFCTVRFSSPRTLDAHVQFYCSKKPTDILLSADCHLQPSQFSPNGYREGPHAVKGPVRSLAADKVVMSEEERSLDSSRCSPVSSDRDASERHSNKDVLKCQYCPYSCWSVSSLTRHKNKIHGVHSQRNSEEQHTTTSARDMFCQDCNIQFSSMSTYRGHKDYYCPKRSQETDSSSSLSPSQKCSNVKPSPQGSPENTMLLSPSHRAKAGFTKDSPVYSGMGGIVVPTQFLSPSIPISMGNQPTVLLAAPILASGGLANITMPAIIMQPVVNNREPSPRINQRASQNVEKSTVEESSPEAGKEKRKEETELPLDLSTKSSSRTSTRREESENSKLRRSVNELSEDGATDLSCPSRREHKSVAKHSNRHNSGDLTPTSDAHTPAPSKSISRGSSESNGGGSPHVEVSPGNPFSGTSHCLLYDQLGSPYVHSQLMPNPALMYGRLQGGIVQGDSRLTPANPHVSKCQECNIVFFKHENFLIHKKHYCASRKRNIDQRSEDSFTVSAHTGEVPESMVNCHISPRKNGLEYKPLKKANLQDVSETKTTAESLPSPSKNSKAHHLLYYCNACSIKFSSVDTLQAHKEFYCSKVKLRVSRESSPRESGDEMDDRVSPREETDTKAGLFSCSECNNSYPSARLLKLHFCNTSPAKASLLRCLYCDFVPQTESKYVDHMKAHAPSKVFRCALCGYRGNTIRGMRMHGKMHVDQGAEFTDEHMLEYEEPPQIPATLACGSSVGPVDVEAELIRMKNEPYKRRRSRKSYEKSEYSPTPKKHGRYVCPLCFGIYPDNIALAEHMEIHRSSSKYPYMVSESSNDNTVALVEHMLPSHDKSDMKRDSPRSETQMHPVKTEKPEDQGSPHMSSHASKQRSKYTCRSCEFTTDSKSALIEHMLTQHDTARVKRENSSSDTDIAIVKKEKMDDQASPKTTTREISDKKSNRSSNELRSSTPMPSPISPEGTERKSARSPTEERVQNGFEEHAEKENVPLPITSYSGRHSRSSSELDETTVSQDTDKLGPKYCKSCDINFTFLSSFLAHKRYYCSGVCPRERVGEADSLSNASLTRQ